MSDKKTFIGEAEDYEAKEKGPHKFKVLGKTINVWATQYQSDEPNPLALKAKSGAHGVWEFDEKPDEFNGQTITRRWLTRFAEVETAAAWANEDDVAPEARGDVAETVPAAEDSAPPSLAPPKPKGDNRNSSFALSYAKDYIGAGGNPADLAGVLKVADSFKEWLDQSA